MKMNRKNWKDRRRGQVMLEYVVVLGIFVMLIGMSALLLYVFKVYGGRVLSLMSSA